MRKRLSERKLILVTRPTRVQHLKRRFNTESQAAFYVQSRGEDFSDYQDEDRTYRLRVAEAETLLAGFGFVQSIDRGYLTNYAFGPEDIVIAIGQDGLVANTLKYLAGGQPLIGVNPDPARWDGVLLPFQVRDLPQVLPDVISRRHRSHPVTMAEAVLNDGQRLLAVNDLFIGPRTHTSARYVISSGGLEEQHSSSGIIVSTGLGSTGWLSSLLHGAAGVSSASGWCAPAPHRAAGFGWAERRLLFTVREPFPSRTTGANLVFGEVNEQRPLRLRSLMSESGVIFSDGVESDFLEFNSGTLASIRVAKDQGQLVGK